jgi:tetratricopeptide (TPR) repeat protein
MGPISRFLDNNSRLWALFTHYQRERFKKFEASKGGSRRDVRFAEFEPQGVLSPEEFNKIGTQFKEDLEEISALASRYNKQIIVSSVPSHEEWKPFFSVRNQSLSGQPAKEFAKLYENGVKKFELKNYHGALTDFQDAQAIDGHVAIISYYLGMCELALGHLQASRDFLREAMDEDGLPGRALYSLADIEHSISLENPIHVHYVDTIVTFHNLIDRGYSYEELLSDFQHPSFMGQIVIGLNFLCEIFKLEPFKSDGRGRCVDAASADLRSLKSNYWAELGLTRKDVAKTALDSTIWHYSLSSLSAYPEVFLDRAEKMASKFYNNSDKSPDDRQTAGYFMELIRERRAARQVERSQASHD